MSQDIPKMLPIVGKSGTLIIFDTDVAHKAGIVSENQHRSIVRFDYFVIENSNLFRKGALIKIKIYFPLFKIFFACSKSDFVSISMKFFSSIK